MTITEPAWLTFIDQLGKLNDIAAGKMRSLLERLPDWYADEHRQELIDYAYALATKYGEASAELACEMYDTMASVSGKTLPPAVPAETATYGEMAKTVNGVIKQAANVEMLSAAVGRRVKMAGVDTTVKNAIRDGAEWAWIPHGDTCAFCITLASRGWQKASKKVLSGNHAEHVHANCDCTFAIRFDSSTNYDGYDPDYYRRLYYSAGGKKPEDKINSLRRQLYAQNSGKVGAETSAAEELLAKTVDAEKWASFSERIAGYNIPQLEPEPYLVEPTTEQIIERLGGGDLTRGSCSSLAFAYAGNKNGFDVLDFRDGQSRKFFSQSGNIDRITEMFGGYIERSTNDFKATKAILEHVEKGKEYYFATGRHAAIIRQGENGLEYLELQSAFSNGFKPLNSDMLKRRFGAQKSHTFSGMKYETSTNLIDIDNFKGSEEYRQILGHINTNAAEQVKGRAGRVR